MPLFHQVRPYFQSLLRPFVVYLVRRGCTASQVILVAAFGSVVVGLLLCFNLPAIFFLLLPAWMLIRLALGVVDEMLAREFNQQSILRAYLRELCDLVSDTALYFPFVFVAPFSIYSIMLIIFMALLTEFVGVMGWALGGSRRYDGPFGKSDRALFFSFCACCLAIIGALPQWFFWLIPVVIVLLGITIMNRIQQALHDIGTSD